MNSDFELSTGKGRSVTSTIACGFGLIGLFAVVSLAGAIQKAFPVSNGPFVVMASELGLPGMSQRFPKGQLQADVRTFMAMLKWIAVAEANAPLAGNSSAWTNQPVSATGTPDRPKSSGLGIGLHQAKDISFRVFAVSEPANARDGHLRQGDGTAGGLCLLN